MKKSIAYIFTFLVFLGLGFFWMHIDKKMNTQKSLDTYQGKELSIPEEYCLTQKGELVTVNGQTLCRIHGIDKKPEELMIQNFQKIDEY
jgi:hypothetical protein